MKHLSLLVLIISFLVVGCGVSQQTTAPDIITVEGRISERGNTPFQAWMLETADRNSYILVMEAEGGQYSSSRTYQVTGRLYLDQWNGRDYAHLEVISVNEIN